MATTCRLVASTALFTLIAPVGVTVFGPRLLVERGLYRYTRNPMYAVVTAALAGEAILFHWPALAMYAAVVASNFHLRVVLVEERVLHGSFGAQFEAYRRRVPRRFIR